MKGFVNAIQNGETGMVFRNSIFLPFHFELLNIWIGKEMSLLAVPDRITDLVAGSDHVGIREGEQYTNIVFRKSGDLRKEFGNEKGHIVLHVAEKGSDIFREENLHYIRVHFSNKHLLTFELIEDPYYL
ncbi:hypothetical protein [Prosthecochloris sp. HL-130-GSB]|jgi:hypothetical protein|uniref:Uncharacterized protein n=1 Tax=Prosthecochloris aestuarii TaxID=1102 RepID=A0A831WUV0_PROAE|nr:hypothetical protein [Prosthecochloris sp. HL-130-GSB]ARM31404.1 hypothetical protein B9H02_08980 [Prosthecochloris sp. HL-130-GSB]MBO8093467.1 hypothetical protein [Prosthecochloris sp.]HED31151.1 hypothetical protein [Prosthecochloris aestuarii]